MKKNILIAFLFLSSTTAFCVKWTITNNNNQYTPDSITINLGDTVRFFIGSIHYSLEVSQSNYNTATDSASVVALPGGFSTPYGGGFVYPAQLGIGVHYYFCPPHADHDMKGRIFVVNTSGINSVNANTSLFNAFPNPVSEKLNVSYNVNEKGPVEIKLLSINGKTSAVLLSETEPAGNYIRSFEINRTRFEKGIYFIELIADKKKSIRKIFIE
ncbi:MAG TPA: T9SS type A sorting domain-containing protein [Bacteroidia bacterium]|nr:T9SS type A sorting domain-containing protein [Bacteroidia bacterium]